MSPVLIYKMSYVGEDRTQGLALLLVRLVLGLLMLYYGLQQVFGLMGGLGFAASSKEFADSFSVFSYIGQAAVIAQLVAGVFLLAGFLTRIAALVVGSLMCVAAIVGARTTETLVRTVSEDPLAAVGYPTALLVMSVVLMLLGGGMLAVDSRLFAPRARGTLAKEA
ncbi:MAG: DoxX family protein [Armatimonadetes bacterium]|nr:DoxX family protein [Armatimonadota bacterium]